jgi:hypothetical protein
LPARKYRRPEASASAACAQLHSLDSKRTTATYLAGQPPTGANATDFFMSRLTLRSR